MFAENARSGIAWLGPRRDCAHLDKTKAEIAKRLKRVRVLVQPSRKAYRIGKLQSHAADRQSGAFAEPAREPEAVAETQALQGQFVRPFRVRSEQGLPGELVEHQLVS